MKYEYRPCLGILLPGAEDAPNNSEKEYKEAEQSGHIGEGEEGKETGKGKGEEEESEKTSETPATTPGKDRGSTTRRKARRGDAPSDAAASVSLGSIWATTE